MPELQAKAASILREAEAACHAELQALHGDTNEAISDMEKDILAHNPPLFLKCRVRSHYAWSSLTCNQGSCCGHCPVFKSCSQCF
jgi:hypothetical protein